MAKRSSNDAKIAREMAELATMLSLMPPNPINWAVVIRLVGPILARLAVRLALKKLKRGMGEDKVNQIATTIASYISDIIKARTDLGGS